MQLIWILQLDLEMSNILLFVMRLFLIVQLTSCFQGGNLQVWQVFPDFALLKRILFNSRLKKKKKDTNIKMSGKLPLNLNSYCLSIIFN